MSHVIAEYGGLLKARWRWLVWGMLIAFSATLALLAVQPPMYRSTALLLVRTPGDVSQVLDGGDSYAEQRTRTYAALVKSTTLSNSVITHLRLDLDPATLSSRFTASSRPGTALLDFSVLAPSPNEAQLTARSALTDFGEMVRALETVPGSIVPRAELTVVDGPDVTPYALGWGVPIQLLLAGAVLAGLLAGAFAAVLRVVLGRGD